MRNNNETNTTLTVPVDDFLIAILPADVIINNLLISSSCVFGLLIAFVDQCMLKRTSPKAEVFGKLGAGEDTHSYASLIGSRPECHEES